MHFYTEQVVPETQLEPNQSENSENLIRTLVEMGYDPGKVNHIVLDLGKLQLDLAIEMLLNNQLNQSDRICAICQQSNNENFINLIDCSDIFCKECLRDYIRIRVEEGEVLTMPCPNHECRNQVEEQLIKFLVSEDLFKKYLKFKNNEELSSNPYHRWCPKPNCPGFDLASSEKHKLSCNSCSFEYCFYCLEAWHPNSKCKFELDKQMDKWAKKNGIKFCPNCRRKVEKNLGCDHMTCTKCRYEWCWLCGEKYSGSHYDNCEVRTIMKKNPNIEYVLKYLAAPLMVPFICVILCCVYVQKSQNTDSPVSLFMSKHKAVSYFTAISIGILLTPLFVAICPFILSIGVCVDFLKNNCINKYLGCFLGVIIGTLTGPLVIIGVVIAAILAHIIGILLLIQKLYVFIRRCKDPSYLKPRNNFRY